MLCNSIKICNVAQCNATRYMQVIVSHNAFQSPRHNAMNTQLNTFQTQFLSNAATRENKDHVKVIEYKYKRQMRSATQVTLQCIRSVMQLTLNSS